MELLYSFCGIIIFSLFDYFGFHISHRKGWEDFTAFNPYRLSQLIVQAVLTAALYLFNGWLAALCFNILWWTWWLTCYFISGMIC